MKNINSYTMRLELARNWETNWHKIFDDWVDLEQFRNHLDYGFVF